MSAGRISRLRWMCRRGMKELDVLLEDFMQQHKRQLSSGSWPELESLLENEDDLLWDLLKEPSGEMAAAYRDVLEAIRGGSE